MIYNTIWVSIYSLKCFKTVWSGLFTSTHCSHLVASYRSNFLRIPITVVHFKDWKWISKTVNCISSSVVCKIVFCSEFPNIPDNAGKVTRRRRRRRTQAIAKCFTLAQRKKRFFLDALFVSFVPARNYLFKVSNWSTRVGCQNCSRLIMKILEPCKIY